MNPMKWIPIILTLIGTAGTAQAFEFCTAMSPKDDLYQDEAETYCKKLGLRLPTTREFASYAKTRGAQGMSETPPNGQYVLVETLDSVGKSDSFYYSKEGYQPINATWRLWTSQHGYTPKTPDDPYSSLYLYCFNARSGAIIAAHPESNWGSACCIQ